MSITSTQIEAIKPAAKVKDYTIEKLGMSRGCLLLRVHPKGDKIFYYRYFQNGAKRFALLGQFDNKGQKFWRCIPVDCT
jgi:hypothetical protein